MQTTTILCLFGLVVSACALDDGAGYAHQELRSVCLTAPANGDQVTIEVEFDPVPSSRCWNTQDSFCEALVNSDSQTIEILAEAHLVGTLDDSCTLYSQDRPAPATCTFTAKAANYALTAEGFNGSALIGGPEALDDCLTAQWGDESASIESSGYSGSSY